MAIRFQAALATLAYIGITCCALAQDKTRGSTGVSSAVMPRPTLTGKERLGPKWTDEQRIDNCHVPVEKRGVRQRPSACRNNASS